MSTLDRITAFMAGGRDAWNAFDTAVTKQERMQTRFQNYWAMYTGTFLSQAWMKEVQKYDMRVYDNISLLVNSSPAIGDFYGMTVYQGDLSTDGQMLPDGTYGAIPIDPQITKEGSEDPDEQKTKELYSAFGELMYAWNWKARMGLRPCFTSVLGSCLTELIDDVDTGMVYPNIVWPGYVTDIELDHVGNVKFYRIEYWRQEVDRKTGKSENFKFAKEVDKETFRYFKNGEPHDYFDSGFNGVEPNPYGFVPAVWDQHKIGWDQFGMSALEPTRQAMVRMNGLLSGSIDFQMKAFRAPIMVTGVVNRTGGKRRRITFQKDTMPSQEDSIADDGQGREDLERLDILPVTSADGSTPSLLQPSFPIGETIALVKQIYDMSLDSTPEVSFFNDLRQMTQVSGPGAERLLSDGVLRVKRARAGQDVGTMKLVQMAITMCGFQVNSGNWGTGSKLTARQKKFKPYNLESYKNGDMDFTVLDRPVIGETQMERLEWLSMAEKLESTWAMKKAGIDEDDILDIQGDRELAKPSFQTSVDQFQNPSVMTALNSGVIAP